MELAAVESSLKRGLVASVYLFFGEETYLRDSLVENFKKTLLPAELGDFNLDIMDGREASQGDIAANAGTLPFMAEKRLVIVQYADFFKASKKAQEEEAEEQPVAVSEEPLLQYLENPNPSTCLIFLVDGGVDKRKKLFKLVTKSGQVVEFPLLKGQALAGWVSQRADNLGRRISREAAGLLADTLGSHLGLLEQELVKLITYLGNTGDTIQVTHVEALMSGHREITIFQLVDAVGGKRFAQAMELVRELLFQGVTPFQITGMLARQFRLIWLAARYLEKGHTEKQIAPSLGVHPFVVSKCLQQGRNFPRTQLRDAFKTLTEADYSMKSGQQDQSAAMEMMLIRLCS
ncbi:MAG TPA: DNA polymerase III subunit delta [Bacillota bacterium]|nr:DNA polymerase III subunit delta [Bacillota bacterium]